MKAKTKIKVKMKPVNTILTQLGVMPDGDVQAHLTMDIMHRMTRYMPIRSSVMATKKKLMASPSEILVDTPYAHYQWKGELMVDRVTGSAWSKPEHGPKRYAGTPLDYSNSGGDIPGPKWDERLMAAEGAQIAADLQKYIERRKRK